MDERTVQLAELPGGVQLAYVSAGPHCATTVVFLHAWAESRGSFDRLLPLMPTTIRCVALDLPGHGQSGKPGTGYSLVALARDVVDFMDAAGIDSAVLAGSSSGGYLAQQVAIMHPQRVSGLVLIGAPRSLHGRPPFADDVDRLVDPIDPAWVRESFSWFPHHQPVPRWYLEDRIRDGAGIPAAVWRETLKGLCDATPPTASAAIACPTLIVWGDHDEVLARSDMEALTQAIAGSQLLIYENTGHLVLWEQPRRVAGDLATFVQALAGNRRQHWRQEWLRTTKNPRPFGRGFPSSGCGDRI